MDDLGLKGGHSASLETARSDPKRPIEVVGHGARPARPQLPDASSPCVDSMLALDWGGWHRENGVGMNFFWGRRMSHRGSRLETPQGKELG